MVDSSRGNGTDDVTTKVLGMKIFPTSNSVYIQMVHITTKDSDLIHLILHIKIQEMEL